MAFGCQMHHHSRLILGKNLGNSCFITDISLLKAIATVAANPRQRLEIAGIGQLIDIDHIKACMAKNISDDGATNKARTTCNKNVQNVSFVLVAAFLLLKQSKILLPNHFPGISTPGNL